MAASSDLFEKLLKAQIAQAETCATSLAPLSDELSQFLFMALGATPPKASTTSAVNPEFSVSSSLSTSADSVVPVLSSDDSEQKESHDISDLEETQKIAEVILQVKEQCRARIEYNRRLFEQLKNTPLDELRNYFIDTCNLPNTKKMTVISKIKAKHNLARETKFYQDKLNIHFQKLFDNYEGAIQNLPSSIDTAFLYLKSLKGEHFYEKQSVLGKEKERTIVTQFCETLFPYVTSELKILLGKNRQKKEYIEFKTSRNSNGDITFGVVKNLYPLVDDTLAYLMPDDIAKKFVDFTDKLRKHEWVLFPNVWEWAAKNKAEWNQHIENYRKTVTPLYENLVHKLKSYPRIDTPPSIQVQSILDVKVLYSQIKEIIIPVKKYMVRFQKELTILNKFFEISKIINPFEQSNDNAFKQFEVSQKDLADKMNEGEFGIKNKEYLQRIIDPLREEITEANYEFINIFGKSGLLRALLEERLNRINDPKFDDFEGLSYALYKLEEFSKALKIANDEMRRGIIKWKLAVSKFEEDKAKADFEKKIDAFFESERKAESSKPKREKRPVLSKEPMSQEAWLALANEKAKKEREVIEREKRERLGIKYVINNEKLEQCYRGLSEANLKAREEMVQKIELNSTAKQYFQALYYPSREQVFGHHELMGLVHALKIAGVPLSVDYADSHYAITCRNLVFYCDDEGEKERAESAEWAVTNLRDAPRSQASAGEAASLANSGVEKGFAFRPHGNVKAKPNSLHFPKHIRDGIQDFFKRCGFSEVALGLMPPEKTNKNKKKS